MYLPVKDYIAVYNSTFNNSSPKDDGVGYWLADDSIIFVNSSFVNNTSLDGSETGAVDARSGLVKELILLLIIIHQALAQKIVITL